MPAVVVVVWCLFVWSAENQGAGCLDESRLARGEAAKRKHRREHDKDKKEAKEDGSFSETQQCHDEGNGIGP